MFAIHMLALAALTSAGAAASAAVPAPQHRRAVAANTQGWRYFKAGQLPRAAMYFRDAVALDPQYVLARYNLACVSSRLREGAAALEQLRWLAASPEPLAKAKLEKSQSDPDLDFASALPPVREILQLPAQDLSQPVGWLGERHGVWSAEQPDSDCRERSYRFTFKADGSLQLTVREVCDGQPLRERSFDGSLAGDGELRVNVPSWPQWPAAVRLSFVACPGLDDAPGSCFTLASTTRELGPFHRGLPGAGPRRARKNLAAAEP